MLIDNLHRINSPSDLFMYICELEKTMEADNEVLKNTANKYLNTRRVLQLFLEKSGWHDVQYAKPRTNEELEVYITATDAEDDIVGVFDKATFYFYNGTMGFCLKDDFINWKVRYWRYAAEVN